MMVICRGHMAAARPPTTRGPKTDPPRAKKSALGEMRQEISRFMREKEDRPADRRSLCLALNKLAATGMPLPNDLEGRPACARNASA